MPWVSNRAPNAPGVSASLTANGTAISWVPDATTAKIAVQARTSGAEGHAEPVMKQGSVIVGITRGNAKTSGLSLL